MSISTKLEYWNEQPDRDEIIVTVHSRKKFYNKDVDWYSFAIDRVPLYEVGHEDMIPNGFLRLPDTEFYEYSGTSREAIKLLTDCGFSLIVNGNEL